MILPWFLVVVMEEFVLVGLGIWHVDNLMKYLDHSFFKLFQMKAGFIVTGIVMSGKCAMCIWASGPPRATTPVPSLFSVARYVLIARIAYSSWTSDYKQLR
jgi:hypothetical protein